MHCLLWIADVPQYGVSNTAEVTQYIDKVIFCQRTWGQEDLDSLVELQVHKHTKTCKKQFRNRTVCRFGFPKYPMFETEILEPLVCDNHELKVHTDNLNHIKLFLASIKKTEEPSTMEDFLVALQLQYVHFGYQVQFENSNYFHLSFSK